MNLFLRMAVLIITLISSGCMASNPDNSFQAYWKEFRTAAISNDYAKLEKLTKFPLEVKGVDDSIPTEYFKKEDFKKIFPKLMRQSIYQLHEDDYIETTMKEIIAKYETSPDTENSKEYQLEQFMFEYIDGHWFFTRAYLEE